MLYFLENLCRLGLYKMAIWHSKYSVRRLFRLKRLVAISTSICGVQIVGRRVWGQKRE